MQESQFGDVQFDPVQIQKKTTQLKQKFFIGHQKTQLKYKNGIVFIGNSRVGKSTLAAILTGIQMRKKLNGGDVVIQPIQQRYRKQQNLIQHTFTSVTSYPNIREMQIDSQYYTTIDLPGFMDTSYQKQLCHWAYIKNILQQLQKIIFVMVLQVHSQNLSIKDDEISMMKRFVQAFPSSDKLKPKENLCLIVNFVENIQTEQKQLAIKQRITKSMEKQLRSLDIYNFYSKSIQNSRLLLIQRARKESSISVNSTNYEPYNIPKLFQFIKSHINKLQKPQPSQYKINLTVSKNKKSLQLCHVIKQLMQTSLREISQRIDEYKKFISSMLSLLSQTQGVTCDKHHYGKLESYSYKHKLSRFRQIQLPKQYDNNNNYNLNNVSQQQQIYQTIEQITFNIVQLFYKMTENKQFQQTKQGLDNLIQKTMLFYRLVQKLSAKMFDKQSYKQFLTITDYVKKSIYIDYLDLVCLNENVADFTIVVNNIDELYFCQLLKDTLYETYSNQIMRIGKIKDNLKAYFEYLLRKYNDLPVNKISIQTLKKLRKACLNSNLKQLKIKSSILIFKTSHKKLSNPHLLANLQLLHQMIDKLNKLQLSKDQQDEIQKWKHSYNQQWQSIKGKNYTFLLKLLTKTGYKNKKELLKLYIDVNTEYDQMITLLKQLVQDVQNDQFNRLTAYQLCLQVKQVMTKNWHISGAIKCCKLAQKLYLYEDKNKTIKAQQAYIQLMKLVMVQDPTSIIDSIDQFLLQKKNQPWTLIKDEQYDKLLKIVYQHSQGLIHKLINGQSENVTFQTKNLLDYATKLNISNRANSNKKPSQPQQQIFSSQSLSQSKFSQNHHINIGLISPFQQTLQIKKQVSAFSQKSQKDIMMMGRNSTTSEKKPTQNSNSSQSPQQPQKKLRGFGFKR